MSELGPGAFRLVSFCTLMPSNHRARKCYGSGCLGCAKDWEECENPACENFEDVTDFSPWVNVSQPDSQGWMEKRFSFKHPKPATASKVSNWNHVRRLARVSRLSFLTCPANCWKLTVGPSTDYIS